VEEGLWGRMSLVRSQRTRRFQDGRYRTFDDQSSGMAMRIRRAGLLLSVLAAAATSGCEQLVLGERLLFYDETGHAVTVLSTYTAVASDRDYHFNWECVVPPGTIRDVSVGDTLVIEHNGESWSYDLAGHPKHSVLLAECGSKGWWVPDFLPDFRPELDRVTIQPDDALDITRLNGQRIEKRPIVAVPP